MKNVLEKIVIRLKQKQLPKIAIEEIIQCGRPAYDLLLDKVLSSKLSRRELGNAGNLIFKLRYTIEVEQFYKNLLLLCDHEDYFVRSEGVFIAATLLLQMRGGWKPSDTEMNSEKLLFLIQNTLEKGVEDKTASWVKDVIPEVE
jgi:hypothetical protein